MHYVTPDQEWVTSRFDATLQEESRAMFQVKADSEATIKLWPMVGAYESEHYSIVIGAYGNQRTELRYTTKQEQTVVLSIGTADILESTEHRTFWVTWTDSVIRFGKGGDFSKMEYFNYKDPHYLTVNGLTFETIQDAEWEIGQLQGVCCLKPMRNIYLHCRSSRNSCQALKVLSLRNMEGVYI